MQHYRVFNVGENRYMAPKMLLVILLVGVQFEGEHCEAGEKHEFPEGFALELVHTNRARLVGKTVTPSGAVVSGDPKPENREQTKAPTKGLFRKGKK